MEKIIIYFTPSELATIQGIPLTNLFKSIKQKQIPYIITEWGIKIPITYHTDNK